MLDKLKTAALEDDNAGDDAETAKNRIEAFVNAGYEGDVCPTDQLVQAAREFDYERFSGGIPVVYQDFDVKVYWVISYWFLIRIVNCIQDI